jgi:biopolymer transport protein ExbB
MKSSACYRRVLAPAGLAGLVVLGGAALVVAQEAGAGAEALGGPGDTAAAAGAWSGGVWELFRQSFDLFTVLLVAGSVAMVWVAYLCAVDLRESRILPEESLSRLGELARQGNRRELASFVQSDDSFPSHALRAALEAEAHDAAAIRETAEIAASEQCARWFRRVEPLSLIGNLGPLVGLAGTVWGMILAFTELGATAGTAGPEDLAPGIAKALFHTLLGLMLAIPALGLFGLFRARVDRICNRGLRISGDLVERLIRAEP